MYLTSSLSQLRHETSGRPVVQILSRIPTRRLRSVGEQADTGSILALLFFDVCLTFHAASYLTSLTYVMKASGALIPNSFIEFAATTQNISLRTGCMCNPGGAAAILGIEEDMRRLYPGVTLADFEDKMGRELGVVRVSLGLASNFQDVWRVIKFAASIGQEKSLQTMWDQWMKFKAAQVGQAM